MCEYGCPVWSIGLAQGQSKILESIQKRAFEIIPPKQPYLEGCEALQIPTLKDRRDSLCKQDLLIKKEDYSDLFCEK